MVGIDLHEYVAAAGAVPVPVPFHPYGVFSDLRQPSKRTSTVRAETYRLWQKGGHVMPVHIPYPMPLPHPAGEAVLMIAINVGASSEG